MRAGVLCGSRLALRVTGAVEIYTGSGELLKSLAIRLVRLEDIENGILEDGHVTEAERRPHRQDPHARSSQALA